MGDVIDVCCGTKMFYYDKTHSDVDFCDIRKESHTLCDNRVIEINPDFQCDFRNLPFENDSYNLVIFDPPHLKKLGKNSWMAKKYGVLFPTWQLDIRLGFQECFRILKEGGTLIFKWNETDIETAEILKLTDEKPLLGHRSGKKQKTHWIVFYKGKNHE